MASWEAFRARGDVEAMKRLMLLTGLLTLLATFAAGQVVLPPIPLCVEGVIGRGLLTSGRPELPRRIEFETQVYHYETPWYDLNSLPLSPLMVMSSHAQVIYACSVVAGVSR
jgi:hypothetical protein